MRPFCFIIFLLRSLLNFKVGWQEIVILLKRHDPGGIYRIIKYAVVTRIWFPVIGTTFDYCLGDAFRERGAFEVIFLVLVGAVVTNWRTYFVCH